MSKHTEGPWIMEPIRGGDKEIFINQPGDSWERLECTVSRDDCDSDMALANAHVIVAAPDMLDALKEITYQAVSWHRFHEGCEHVKCDAICAAIPACEAAIAKAEGRT